MLLFLAAEREQYKNKVAAADADLVSVSPEMARRLLFGSVALPIAMG